jgi:hypothetical protein
MKRRTNPNSLHGKNRSVKKITSNRYPFQVLGVRCEMEVLAEKGTVNFATRVHYRRTYPEGFNEKLEETAVTLIRLCAKEMELESESITGNFEG